MTNRQISIVRSTWDAVSTLDPVMVGELFYQKLFELSPEVRPMFRNPMPEQSRKLLAMIGYVISKLDKLSDIISEVQKLAQRHVHYGVKESHYEVVGIALLDTLEKGLGEQWNDEALQAWTTCYTILSGAMIKAAYVGYLSPVDDEMQPA
jgi:hemoglobin-like flavoprotein